MLAATTGKMGLQEHEDEELPATSGRRSATDLVVRRRIGRRRSRTKCARSTTSRGATSTRTLGHVSSRARSGLVVLSCAATVLISNDSISSVNANWLLSCSSCVDQTYFADEKLKADVTPADTESLLDQVKRLQVKI